LDQIEDQEEGVDPEELGASFVRVLVAGRPIQSKAFTRSYISAEQFGGEPALVCTGVNSSLALFPEEDIKDATVDTVILSSVTDIREDTPIQSGCMKTADLLAWRKQSPEHNKVWKAAFSQVARKIGHVPKFVREVGAVGCISSSLYDKWYGGKGLGKRLEGIVSGKGAGKLRRVISALRGRLAEGKSLKVIKSDYNGYKNFQTWNVAAFLKQDVDFRSQARAFLKSNKGATYDQLIQGMGLAGTKTPDQVDWLDRRVDRGEMAKVLAYLNSVYRGAKMGDKIRSATQVDGGEELNTVQDDTSTGISTAGKTFTSDELEGENSIKVTEVSGGDTSEVVDVDNTGNDGNLEADIDAGTEFNDSGYSFDSGKIAALELPIEDENDSTQVLKMREIGSGVYVLDSSYKSPGAGRCSFVKGKDAVAVLSRNIKPAPIKTSVDRILTLKGSKNGLLVRSSAVLGVIAIEAPFTKGLRNSKYSLFSRTGVNLVNEDGYYIPLAKGPQMIIASALSNKSVRRGAEKRNVFSEVEWAYIQYLKSCLQGVCLKNKQYRDKLSQALQENKRIAKVQSRALAQERQTSRRQVASSLADLQAIRLKSAETEAGRVFSASQRAIRDEQEAIKSQAERNIDYLASLM
jgi:hypothetical protein